MDPTSVLALRTEQTTRLMDGDRLPPIMERFQKGYCRRYTSLLDHDELLARKLERPGGQEDLLLDETVFLPGAFSARQNWALYWAVEQSVAEVSGLCASRGLNEEFQTAALFGALRANLSVYAALDPALEEEGRFSFYFADCKSESTESSLGADFALIYPLSEDRFKVALFQAKIARNGLANVYRYNDRRNSHQLDQLAATNKSFLSSIPSRKLRGQCCYYAFWNAGAMLRPTVRTVGQVENDVAAQKRAHNWTRGDIAKVWAVSSFRRATYFSEMISLLLPAEDVFAGTSLDWDDLIDLLTRPETRPKHVLGISSTQTGFTLRHWLDVCQAVEPTREEFSAIGEIYNRDQLTPDDPSTGYDPFSK